MAKRDKLELLSPARDLKTGIEAVNHGADAVYIGAPAFGARAAVPNSVSDIEKLARHAHRYGARVYAALNTILTDKELPLAVKIAHELGEAGADALIIQDVGLLECDLPSIALHASTQMDNRTPEKVLFLEKCGFSQVVLARELSIGQIRTIAAETSVNLEYFVHGALCVSYSGRCYLSSHLTGRSANRGECAQPCRLPLALLDENNRTLSKNSHLLSLRDMNQSANLKELIDAGITSFKIEGRLKDINYVKNVTAHYRMELDALLGELPDKRRSSAGKTHFFFTPDVKKTFNRGFTDYFIHGRQASITSFDTPKFAGEFVGIAGEIRGGKIIVEGAQELHNGDGLAFFDPKGELTGFRANRAVGRYIYPAEFPEKLKKGDRLFRNLDFEFEKTLSGKTASRKIGVKALLKETGGGFSLSLTDDEGVCATFEIAHEKIQPKDASKALETIKEQLSKLGDTIFEAQRVEVDFSGPLFLPVGKINELRRETAARLLSKREGQYKSPERLTESNPPPLYPERNLGYSHNVYNEAARRFYLRHGVGEMEEAFETGKARSDGALMTTKHCLRFSFGFCPKQNPSAGSSDLYLELGGKLFTLSFDCRMCEMAVSAKSRAAK